MTREQMTADLIEMWLADMSAEDLEAMARDALEARYRYNYSDADIAAEHAELITNADA